MRKFNRRGDRLVWLDMEMSGLDPGTCVPLEIATIITDDELNVLAEGPTLVIHQPDSVLDAMDEWNTKTHGESGLIDRVRTSTTSCAQAESMTLSFIGEWTEPGKALLAGNSIGQDRRFIRRYMPALEQHLHYRSLDVSSIKELARRWFGVEPPPKRTAHRALDDIRESIDELRFYRRVLFRATIDEGVG